MNTRADVKTLGKSRSGHLACLLLAAVGIGSLSAQTNLIQDGGFELGLTGGEGTLVSQANYGAWTAAPGPTNLLGMPFAGIPALEGVEALNVGDSTGYVEQSFPTTIGVEYEVSVSVVGFGGQTAQVQVTVSSTSQTDLVADYSGGGNVWSAGVDTFIASGTETTIKIQSISGLPTIDDVKVTSLALPDPDSDGDGFPDEVDEFPNSYTDLYLEVGNVLIENIPLGNGAFLADEILFALDCDPRNKYLVLYLQAWREAGYLSGEEMGRILGNYNAHLCHEWAPRLRRRSRGHTSRR